MNYYDPYYSDYDAVFGGFLLIAILVCLVLAIIGYIISSLIYFMSSKTNGFSDVAYIAWIPIINVYSLFLLTANGEDDTTVRAAAKKNTLIYAGLFIVSFVPLVGMLASLAMLGYVIYYCYRLMYRWSGESGKAILYIILSIITGGLFFMIYGLMRMKRPFKV
ncbi:hypothetical protein [Lysinibacillus sphaericus]|uniref:Uncharacterized protein n=1 Tax=Lysinibacillus sphaericus OT4b.31 TaxID=1285586 RepID=R7ZEF3_LYSSH|nr:hypothetical protein [Lysinibacillus sphaericus]EON72502.1 hypothetical protein H131_10193 [Lysinibacillus sphaericus OT4b.31]